MSEGQLYRMDTETEEVEQVTLSGGDLCSADGLLLDGNTLYGVQNFSNQIAVVEMGSDFPYRSGHPADHRAICLEPRDQSSDDHRECR
ncbi:MAG: hypothetical protein GEU90_21710 [Gemmatimonas sp.]|nr:hypothetical protein [Gemmatimonas sp.]